MLIEPYRDHPREQLPRPSDGGREATLRLLLDLDPLLAGLGG